ERRASRAERSLRRRGSRVRVQLVDEQVEEAFCVDVDADVTVRLPAGAAPQVDERAPARQLRLGVDLHTALERLDEVRMGDMRDGDRVVDRRAVPAVLLLVEAAVEREQLAHHLPQAALEPRLVLVAEERFM